MRGDEGGNEKTEGGVLERLGYLLHCLGGDQPYV